MPLKWGQGPGQEAEEESQKCGLYLQDPPASLHTPTSLTLQTRAPDGPSELRIRLRMLQGHGPLTNISQSLLSVRHALGCQSPHGLPWA